MVNKAALLPRCEGDTGTLHTEQAHLINRRIFTSSDLIKGRRVSRAHAARGGANLPLAAGVLSLTHKQHSGGRSHAPGAETARSDCFISSETKQAPVRYSTHVV